MNNPFPIIDSMPSIGRPLLGPEAEAVKRLALMMRKMINELEDRGICPEMFLFSADFKEPGLFEINSTRRRIVMKLEDGKVPSPSRISEMLKNKEYVREEPK